MCVRIYRLDEMANRLSQNVASEEEGSSRLERIEQKLDNVLEILDRQTHPST